ncbi:hypothetical protein [Pedobacter agri]|uniref:hypothetical protein n=1 Tax=Pedobacter agri TaxID=454586 RepID=UPI00292D190C|nr:hypothetical protein [Pedobacter agri]
MDNHELRNKKAAYLEREVFAHLENLNDGFDAPSIQYFSEQDFQRVLERVQELGLGIYGIEPFLNGEYFGVAVYEEYGMSSTDSNWYMSAFERFKQSGEELQYSASYDVSEHLLV